jgi:hypothetical protein
MQIKTVGERDPLRDCAPSCCNRAIRPGQVVLVQKLLEGSMLRPRVIFHVPCLRAAIESAPQDCDERAFLELQAAIHRTGDPFPE